MQCTASALKALQFHLFSIYPLTKFNISCLEYQNNLLYNCTAYILSLLQSTFHVTANYTLKMQVWSPDFPTLKDFLASQLTKEQNKN